MAARHFERSAFIRATPKDVFALVDDHERLSSHMGESSAMMGGSGMSVELDETRGKAVGSRVRLSGRVFGIHLHVHEVVTRRDPPISKVWKTVGIPKLLVIGAYAMGVEVAPQGAGSRLRVFIDYDFPDGRTTYWLGRLLGRFYAAWCVEQMLAGVSREFAMHSAFDTHDAAAQS